MVIFLNFFFSPVRVWRPIENGSTTHQFGTTGLESTLDDISLAVSTTVRNLGGIFDQNLSFYVHIKQVSSIAFFHLRNIAKIRNILSQSDAEKLVHAFVTSKLYYCNSLLLGCPKNFLKSLQLIQNAALVMCLEVID